MLKKKIFGLLMALTVIVGLGFTGCKSGRLENGGAYAPGNTTYATNADGTISTNFVATAAPDLALFQIDSAFKFAYQTALTVFELEQTNETLLWGIDHNIKHTLDKLRPQVVSAVQEFAKARKAYIANPSPAGLSALDQVLSEMQRIMVASQAALPQKKS